MEDIIKNENFSVNEFETLIDLLNQYGGIAYTQNLATKYIEDAKAALSIFEASETKEILMNVADYTLVRDL